LQDANQLLSADGNFFHSDNGNSMGHFLVIALSNKVGVRAFEI
jgi:hypothetical protein